MPGSTITNPSGLATCDAIFGQVLGARDADRDRQAELGPHPLPDRAGNVGRRTEQVSAPGNIGEGFVDGNPLDERREIIEHLP